MKTETTCLKEDEMFKNYLTYQFALSFHQLCLVADMVDVTKKHRLVRSAEQMTQSFTRSLNAKTEAEEGSHFFSCLLNLREAKETLEECGLFFGEIESKFRILHDRLEKLTEKAAKADDGQMMMLG